MIYDNNGKVFVRPSTRAIIIKDSIKEYGYVHRKHKSIYPNFEIFDQNNYYYICDVENNKLDDYENFEKITLN